MHRNLVGRVRRWGLGAGPRFGRPRAADPVPGGATGAHCCVAGAGPAGAVLALLLARRGLRVTLLEAREAFDREFRGNTLNAASLEILAGAGVVGRVTELRHTVVPRFVAREGGRETVFADFARLEGETPYPYVLMLPQAEFLRLVVEEAGRYPGFELRTGARVRGLIEEGGRVRGVRHMDRSGEEREVRAEFTVGADGRFSAVRKAAGLRATSGRQVMDVLWFDLPRVGGDPEGTGERFSCGHGGLLAVADHGDRWRLGYLIRKGTRKEVEARGLGELRRRVALLAPELAGRVGHLRSWGQIQLLPVESDRLGRWHRPGLLMIGDAAHVVSPIGGVGINLAIQDATVAAELLAGPLSTGLGVKERRLRAVQRRREGRVRLVQVAQDLTQRRIVDRVLRSEGEYALPATVRAMLRAPVARDVPTRLIAYGGLRRPRPVRSARAGMGGGRR